MIEDFTKISSGFGNREWVSFKLTDYLVTDRHAPLAPNAQVRFAAIAVI